MGRQSGTAFVNNLFVMQAWNGNTVSKPWPRGLDGRPHCVYQAVPSQVGYLLKVEVPVSVVEMLLFDLL